jgi:hypothetical protein
MQDFENFFQLKIYFDSRNRAGLTFIEPHYANHYSINPVGNSSKVRQYDISKLSMFKNLT